MIPNLSFDNIVDQLIANPKLSSYLSVGSISCCIKFSDPENLAFGQLAGGVLLSVRRPASFGPISHVVGGRSPAKV